MRPRSLRQGSAGRKDTPLALTHEPVMVRAVIELLKPVAGGVFVDCTAGLGGHTQALLREVPDGGSMLLIDRDAGNLRAAKDRLQRTDCGRALRFFHAEFAQIRQVLSAAEVLRVDALLADLGVASTQLDDPGRGMSFSADGPLDMRMDAESDQPTAGELVNTLPERDLADLIYRYGEERASRRIAAAIARVRADHRIETTAELAEIVSRALGGRRGAKIHPATRTFQALRIAVNDELKQLEDLLASLPEVLAPGGRAAIISFHSLEDRAVKRAFSAMKSAGIARIITPKPLTADDEEKAGNPRSRSAKLRCVERV